MGDILGQGGAFPGRDVGEGKRGEGRGSNNTHETPNLMACSGKPRSYGNAAP